MDRRKLGFLVFACVVLFQLYIPARMIWDRENVLAVGTLYKFKTAPVDPNDPFRGKYVVLSFEQSTLAIEDESAWSPGETAYVVVITDEEGYAKVERLSRAVPGDDEDYFEARVNFVTRNGSNSIALNFPFDRFYLEESKAPDAETVYRESQSDSTQVTYALVSVSNGGFVLQDVLIDGVPIKEIVQSRRNIK